MQSHYTPVRGAPTSIVASIVSERLRPLRRSYGCAPLRNVEPLRIGMKVLLRGLATPRSDRDNGTNLREATVASRLATRGHPNGLHLQLALLRELTESCSTRSPPFAETIAPARVDA